ncbi:hypothetical protein HHL19_03220 [Streptomyces sp. R302]|uniref:hypothetical protein n=1 Tax=unclassified Streptomyces TaxID=2593676 RepID=UPI00145F4A16|nr:MULTISPECIES: hypothetical protein [unclassified Streptomyces]NML49360.1 hypothetical protein [Streptomyces sp. R301]NML77687.1 hypothetical protein [Streptomyces sp. R302]
MSSHEPGQSWPPQPGHAPGQYPEGPAYGVVYTAPPTRPPSHRGAWIGAGATLVAAVIGVVGTYLASSGNDNTPAAAPAPAPTSASPSADDKPTRDATAGTDTTPTADTAPTTDAASTPSAPATPSGPAPDTVHWQGTLVITYVEDKDLDAAPPVMSEINRDNDFAVFPFGDHMLRPDNGAKALVWKGAAKAPTYEDCAGVVDTQATSNDIRIKTGLTVCGRTGEGRLVRMTVKDMAGQAGDTNATFDVVVWAG